MNTIDFDKLLLRTAFCCMAADGDIDPSEIDVIKNLCNESPLFLNFNFRDEINALIQQINSDSKGFILSYFQFLEKSSLAKDEELTVIDFALKTINADGKIDYSEVKFFKNIRHRLKVTDAEILERFPEIELYLEEDIVTDSYLDKITKQYLENINLPQFNHINIADQPKTQE